MALFQNIPHSERTIYKRTFMNEIVIFFMYKQMELTDDVFNGIIANIEYLGCEISMKDKEGGLILYIDKNARVTITNKGTFVSLSSKEYRDFTSTSQVWEHLEVILKGMEVSPMMWSFSKGNRFPFNKSISVDNYKDVYNLILSKDLINAASERNIYIEEAKDKSCVFTCHFDIERIKETDGLSLKTTILSLTYSLADLNSQVQMRNQDMYDCWHWTMNDETINLMNQ